jgi:hypothetical protein
MAPFRTDGPRGRDRAFATQKFVVWRSLVDDPQRSLLYKYACMRAASGTMDLQDGQMPGTPSAGSDIMMDGLLTDLLPIIESASGLDLFPTYSYFRVYRRGDLLRKHTDRPACEISISLCLGYRADSPWPIWIEGPAGVSRVELEPGDALLYRGIECPHWRDACEGENVAQVFLHYVDRHGPHADWKYDKRPSLGAR